MGGWKITPLRDIGDKKSMAERAHHNEGRGQEKAGKSARGSVNNAKRLSIFTEGRNKGSADWGGCSPDLLQAVVVAITDRGGAITVGLSRDQGAHSLTLLLDGDRETLWFNGAADLDEELRKVLAVLNEMPK